MTIISLDTLIAMVGSLAAVGAVVYSARVNREAIIRDNAEQARVVGERIAIVETKVGFLMGHFGLTNRAGDPANERKD